MALEPTTADLKALEPILNTRFDVLPNIVFHIYKNRRGKWTRVKVWSYADLGTCRIRDLFMTDNEYKLVPIDETIIETYFNDENGKDDIDTETGEILNKDILDF